MSRSRKFLYIPIIILMVILTSCSDDSDKSEADSDWKSEAIEELRSSTTSTTSTTTAPTTTTLPLILDAPIYQEFCSQVSPYCVEVPTAGETLDSHPWEPADLPGVTADSFDTSARIDPATGRTCTAPLFEEPTECQNFDHMGYHVTAFPVPEMTEAEALDRAYRRYTEPPSAFHDVHQGYFAGVPAIVSEFHTRNGGIGPYISFFRDGILYEITTNGQYGPSYNAQRFLDSFRFTD